MRIATYNAHQTSVDSLMSRQASLADTQLQLTSGKRVAKAGDDPAAAARSERAQAAQARQAATQRAVDASDNVMTLTEGALGDAGELLQGAREQLLQAGNGSLSDADRASLADSLASIRQQLLGVANRTDGNGSYLFGGQGASGAPFSDAPGGVRYGAPAGQVAAAGSDDLPLSIDGRSAWMNGRTGNGVFATGSAGANTGSGWIDGGKVVDPSAVTGSNYSLAFSVQGGTTTYSVLRDGAATATTGAPYTSGQAIEFDGISMTVSGTPANGDTFSAQPSTPTLSPFSALDTAIADLRRPGMTNGQKTQTSIANLSAIDAVSGALLSARSVAGTAMNRASAATGRLGAATLASRTEQSNAEDLDMTQAVSNFQNQQTGYQAALQAYAKVQNISLLNYLGN